MAAQAAHSVADGKTQVEVFAKETHAATNLHEEAPLPVKEVAGKSPVLMLAGERLTKGLHLTRVVDGVAPQAGTR